MNLSLPKISIITPTYNQGQFIEQTIQSVLNQDYPNLEYIIIDGGSTDNTLEIIKKYEKRISFWMSEKDRGQSEAINKGFRIATGDVINWLNSDDYYEPGALIEVANAFKDSAVNVYCGINRSFGSRNESYSLGTDIYNDVFKTMGLARIDQPETFFRKACIDEIGYVNESLHYVMDRDLWFRYLSRFGLSGVIKENKLLAHFRLHESSKTVSMLARFKKEHRDIYFTYAVANKLDFYSRLIKDLFPVQEVPLTYLPQGLSVEQWQQVLNYFLWQEGLEAYAHNNFILSKYIFKHIRKELLVSEDKREMEKVLLRMRILPVAFKKILNRI